MKFRNYTAFVLRNAPDLIVIVVGFLVTLLNIFGIFGENQQYLWAAISAILAISAFSSLRQRETLQALGKVEELAKFGLSKISGSFVPHTVEQHFSEANREVLILQTWLQDTVTLIPGTLSSALKRGVKLKILILDPNSPILAQRLKDVGLPKDSQIAHIGIESLWATIKEQKLERSNLEVRMYCALPPFSLYMVDEWMLIGFCWHGQTNVRGPHLEVFGKDTIMGQNATRTFNNMWEMANPVKIGTVPVSAVRSDPCPQ